MIYTPTQGEKTPHYIDVKMPICAGKSGERPKKIGYYIARLYYDTAGKDCQVGSETIKKHFNA